MKVLCLYSNSFGGGGTESVLRHGLPLLHRIPGIHITFCDLYSRAAVSRKFADVGLPTWGLAGTESDSIVSARAGFHRVLDVTAAIPLHARIARGIRRAADRFDALYVHGYKDLVLCQAACLAGPSRPIVWHCHGIPSDALPPMLRTLANRCARVIAISGDVGKRLIAIGVRPAIVRTIYNSVDYRRTQEAALRLPVQPLPATTGRRIVLLCPAAIRADKGLHLAIQALRSLPGDVDLWITGDTSDPAAADYLRELRSLAERENLRERVCFLDFRTDLPSVMSLAHAICVPSICREGFGLVAAEAMALGKPIVASSRGALREVVGNCGLIFDPDQPGDLARQLSALLADPLLAKSLGDAGRQTVSQRFSYDRWAHEIAAELRAAVLPPEPVPAPAGPVAAAERICNP